MTRATLGSLHRFTTADGVLWVAYYGSPSARYWTAESNRGRRVYAPTKQQLIVDLSNEATRRSERFAR